MFKTNAPKGLHGAMLRPMMEEMDATPAELAKWLKVTERTVFRWIADDSAPFAVLAALWHETPSGQHDTNADIGNALMYARGHLTGTQKALELAQARMAKLVSIADFGCANDPMMDAPPPGGGPGGFMPRPRYPARVLRSFGRHRARC